MADSNDTARSPAAQRSKNDDCFGTAAERILRYGCEECPHRDLARSLKDSLRHLGFAEEASEATRELMLNWAVHRACHIKGETHQNIQQLFDPDWLFPLDVFAVGLDRVLAKPQALQPGDPARAGYL